MADVTIKIDIDAKTTAIERVRAQLAALAAQADAVEKRFRDFDDRTNKLGRSLISLDDELKNKKKDFDALDKQVKKSGKSFDDVDKKSGRLKKGFKKLGDLLKTFGKLLLKAFLINLAATAAALVAVNLAFKAGAALAKGYKVALSGVFQVMTVAGAAALTVLSTFLAGQKEFLAAQQASRYGGGATGLTQASTAMRSLTGNTQLAVLGTEALQGAFAQLSQHTRMTGQLSQALQSMGDFAAASGDPKKSFAAAGAFLGQLQKKGKLTKDIVDSAKEIGPEFEKAVKDAKKKGITSSDAFMAALIGGDLSGEVAGQLELVNSTLFGTAKRYMGVIKTMFTDFGQPLLKPATEALQQVAQIIQRTFMSISGDVRAFATGTFFDTIISGMDRFGHWTVKIFTEYLPKAEGMFGRIKGFFSGMYEGFNRFKEAIRPLTEGGQVLIDTFKPLLSGMFGAFGQGLYDFNELVKSNKDEFLAFGDSLLNLFRSIGDLFGAVKEGVVKFLPTLTRLVDLLAGVIDVVVKIGGPIINGLASVTNFLTGLPGILGDIATAMIAIGMAALYASSAGGAAGAAGGAAGGLLGRVGGMKGLVGKGLKGGGKLLSKIGPKGGLAIAGAYMGYKAWNSESAVGGALYGAGSGAAIGAMFGGPVGAAVGAVIGGVAGAIKGKLNEAAKHKKEVEEAARVFATGLTDAAMEAFKGGDVSGARSNMKRMKDQASRIARIVSDYRLSGGGESTETKVEQLLKRGIISEEEAKELAKAPVTYANALKEQANVMSKKVNPLIIKFNNTASLLGKITGKSQAEIERLADKLDIDLSQSLENVGEVVEQLTGLVVYGTSAEMQAAFRDAFSQSLINALQKPGETRRAGEAVTEAERSLRDVVAAGGTPQAQQIEDYLMTAAQFDLAQGRTPAEALARLTGRLTKESDMFGPNGMFAGMGDVLIPLFSQSLIPVIQGMASSPEFQSSALTASSALADAGFEVSASSLMDTMNAGLAGQNSPEEMALYISEFMTAVDSISKGIITPDLLSAIGITGGEGGSHGSAKGMGGGFSALTGDQISAWLASMGLDVTVTEIVDSTGSFFTGFTTAMQTATTKLLEYAASIPAESPWVGSGGQLDPIIDLNGNGIDDSQEGGDTTSSRLASTLSRHAALDRMLPGKRTITSSYRRNNLGSLNSDHVTGNAYDLVGQNLVSYAAMVNKNGGFAEFHGGLQDRHLHVVPGDGPTGDTMAPIASLSPVSGASGSTISNSYQFTINASEGASPREIANEVMERIYREQRSARERQ